MSLITCPDCERQISTLATACPGCGCPISGNSPHQGSTGVNTQLRSCPDCVQGKIEQTCGCCDGTGQDICRACDGNGVFFDAVCSLCHGNPRHICDCCAGRGHKVVKCPSCEGVGQLSVQNIDSLKHAKQEEARQRELELEKRRQAQKKHQEEQEERKKEARRCAEAEIEDSRENRRYNWIKYRISKGCCVICGEKFGLLQKKAEVQTSGSIGQSGLFYSQQPFNLAGGRVALAHEQCVKTHGSESSGEGRRIIIRNML